MDTPVFSVSKKTEDGRLGEYGKNEGLRVPHRVPVERPKFLKMEGESTYTVGNSENGTMHVCRYFGGPL